MDDSSRNEAKRTSTQTGVMHNEQHAQPRQALNSGKVAPRFEDLMLPPATLPLDPQEDATPRQQHVPSSRRRSFGRPSPFFRSQRHGHINDDDVGTRQHRHSHGYSGQLSRLVNHIQEWIDLERTKNEGRDIHHSHKADFLGSLEKLQQILHRNHQQSDQDGADATGQVSDLVAYHHARNKRSSISLRKLGRAQTFGSDTENETERHPPSVETVLDNSKTLNYTASTSTTDLTRRSTTSSEAWHVFKTEIVRLAHTLKCKGWRRVPLVNGDDIEVHRLSGALTNAVYVVIPPKNLPESTASREHQHIPRPLPAKLLLRIYGPQVEHLIDRDSELAILRRLARKNIGPKLLGTFTNGRFEEFLNATPLTAAEIRDGTISQQIAKRMRELHVGITLLPEERDAGPFVWQNWDKWKERCEEVIEWLDEQVIDQAGAPGQAHRRSEAWRSRGHVCGVEWRVFRTAVRSYRTWLEEQYGGYQQILDSLVFAHNDTQYGNLLRLMPDDKESPLLQPANQHRRLVVIDFEYANANTPGMEFANHFTEWCYNYHSSSPHSCVTDKYPTPEEQRRFIRAYISHVPHFSARTPGATPVLAPAASPAGGPMHSPLTRPQLRGHPSSFTLDARAHPGHQASQGLSSSVGSFGSGGGGGGGAGYPGGGRSYEEEERLREDAVEGEVSRLMHEARLWRVANSAQWVAWGIVQAKVPGMEAALEKQRGQRAGADKAGGDGGDGGNVQLFHDTATEPRVHESGADGEDGEDDGDEAEFDYLAYAQERALFFWGDVLTLGLVREDELPRELVAKAKRVGC